MRDYKELKELCEAKRGLYANIHAKRKRGEAPAKSGSKDYPAKDAFQKAARTAKESFELTTEAAWTKKSGKNKEGGLNEKGRRSYEKENPGSDLKAPSKKVGNPRRASFCARMKGMKKKLTSKKTKLKIRVEALLFQGANYLIRGDFNGRHIHFNYHKPLSIGRVCHLAMLNNIV